MLILLPPVDVPYLRADAPQADADDDLCSSMREAADDVREAADAAEKLVVRLSRYTHPAVDDGEYPARA